MRPPSIPTTIPIDPEDSKQIVGMKRLYNALIEYREPKSHRILIQLFMCLPSRKDFPGYYSVIENPIAMNKIRERIEQAHYNDEDACLKDLKLMFRNCKFFNEDDSQIYKDAVSLENVLNKLYSELHSEPKNVNHKPNNRRREPEVKIEQVPEPKVTEVVKPIVQNISTSNHQNTYHNNATVTMNEDSESGSLKVNDDHLNETSMDSSSNLSADLLASTPVEKCSLNTRRGKNSDAPKRQLLTGYIIYASEIRKQVIDKNPNQNFGDISRLVGNEWKALPQDIRSKYDQRALIHNKRVRERAQLDLNSSNISNGLHTPKLTKRKLAKLAKEQMKQHHLSLANHDESSNHSHRITNDQTTPFVQNSLYQSQPVTLPQTCSTQESSTQTTTMRFVEPPKRRLTHSQLFKKYLKDLKIPAINVIEEQTDESRSSWLGAGIGRHESTESALWALRDFMLQDDVSMRRSMEPYL